MERLKRISAEQLLAQRDRDWRTVMWHGHAVSVRTLLPIEEISPFIDSVMEVCWDETHDMPAPEMMDFAFRVNVVTRYACVELPENIGEQYEVMYGTDIFDTIGSAVNAAQLQSLKETLCHLVYRGT